MGEEVMADGQVERRRLSKVAVDAVTDVATTRLFIEASVL